MFCPFVVARNRNFASSTSRSLKNSIKDVDGDINWRCDIAGLVNSFQELFCLQILRINPQYPSIARHYPSFNHRSFPDPARIPVITFLRLLEGCHSLKVFSWYSYAIRRENLWLHPMILMLLAYHYQKL
jgi:hypothetical protein